mmetsp:Transcript_10713/g.25407  ORF Transcript_10713/g.25407 Transcript_10713/m.25407 type:complete len:206 (-) Transcript_10713:2130-2747(-)
MMPNVSPTAPRMCAASVPSMDVRAPLLFSSRSNHPTSCRSMAPKSMTRTRVASLAPMTPKENCSRKLQTKERTPTATKIRHHMSAFCFCSSRSGLKKTAMMEDRATANAGIVAPRPALPMTPRTIRCHSLAFSAMSRPSLGPAWPPASGSLGLSASSAISSSAETGTCFALAERHRSQERVSLPDPFAAGFSAGGFACASTARSA